MKKGLLGYALKLAAASLIAWFVTVLLFTDQVVFQTKDTEESAAVAGSVENIASGTYTGVAQGHNAPLEVQVEVEDGVITAVELVDHAESEGIADPAIEEIPAAIVEANGTEGVEAVSGATVTSEAILTAVNGALAGESGAAVVPADEAEESEETSESAEESEEAESVAEEETEEAVVAPVAKSDATYEDGTYQATTDGHNGPLSVEVTVADGAITDVAITEHEETEGISDPAIEEVPAAIVEANGTEGVEAVSGATVTSEAILTAVNDVLAGEAGAAVVPADEAEESEETSESAEESAESEESAEESEESAESEETSEESAESTSEESSDVEGNVAEGSTVAIEDGTYTGVGEGHNGDIEVEVTVENGAITAIDVLNHEETKNISDPAFEEVPAQIIENNSTELVEAVTGATVSSQGIVAAVEDALGFVSGEEASEEGVVIPDGTYEGVGKGHNGDIEVEVTVKDGAITEIEILDHQETKGLSDPAFEEVPASIIENNSTVNVETVSGATVTSEAIIAAVEDALKISGGEELPDIAIEDIEDGTYEGVGKGRNADIKVEVTVKDGKITKVDILEHEETEGISDPAIEELPKTIVEENSYKVDAVTGASKTSKGIIEAVYNALESAQK